MNRHSNPDTTEPWWSAAGPEQCEFCLQSFYQESGYYCADCDRPVCPVCVIALREHKVTRCPQCHPAESG